MNSLGQQFKIAIEYEVKKKMLVNKRKWYCEKFAGFLSLHPEQVNPFIVLLCDEISIVDLEMIYRQIQEVSKKPLTPEQITNLRN